MVPRLYARACVPAWLALLGVTLEGGMACSSSSSLVGNGACDGFCTKWVGAHCTKGPTAADCLTKCLTDQGRCREEENALLHCATVDGTIACETGSFSPKVLGCDKFVNAIAACLTCDAFCDEWSGSALTRAPKCLNSPNHEACKAACLSKRCAPETRAFVACAAGRSVACVDDFPYAEGCDLPLLSLAKCLASTPGGTHPFDWPPIAPP
ncbi:MAG: hypothetical protein NVS3B20_02540 [Polyangiales bacterium]